ncbi:hypothetical protein TSOC_014865, partial [Tetrabaena socialis]
LAAASAAPLSNGGLGGPAPTLPVAPPGGPITGAALGELVRRFRRLQNGSDIRGIALEGVPNEPITLSAGAAFFIGTGFARWLRSKGDTAPKISIGRDPRLSGPLMESAFAAGLLHGGAGVVHLFGLATTPAMFYSIVLSGAQPREGLLGGGQREGEYGVVRPHCCARLTPLAGTETSGPGTSVRWPGRQEVLCP